MLLGRPPFETTNLKETYRCIREARYTMPSSLLAPAKHLIASMLSKNPEDRPSLDDIIRHEFFLQVGTLFFFFFGIFLLHALDRNCPAGYWKHFLLLYRVSHQTDSLLAVVIQFPISTCQAQLRISLRRQLLLFLVAKKTKPDILTHIVSYKTFLLFCIQY